MKKFQRLILFAICSTMPLMMIACSEEKNEETSKNKNKGDHVWKQQTDTLKSAKEMAKKMQQSLDQQQKDMEKSN
jgi:hypothetical protein